MKKKFGAVQLERVTGDITAQEGFDAVVNAANAQLAPGDGVAGAVPTLNSVRKIRFVLYDNNALRILQGALARLSRD